jgi:hypothetical protein
MCRCREGLIATSMVRVDGGGRVVLTYIDSRRVVRKRDHRQVLPEVGRVAATRRDLARGLAPEPLGQARRETGPLPPRCPCRRFPAAFGFRLANLARPFLGQPRREFCHFNLP